MREDPSKVSDEELIKAALSGNDDAFRDLIKRFEPIVASTIIGMLGNCPEAEDVGQETFIRFYNGLKYFRGDASVGTYITRIAINLSLNELKRRKRRMHFFQRQEDEYIDIPDNNNPKNYDGEKEIVQQAISKLESKFRSVVVLRLIDGYSTAETAQILKIPTGTVLSRLARAQKKLKNSLHTLMGETA